IGKQMYKDFFSSIGILNEINNSNDNYYTSNLKFKENNAVLYYLGTYKISDIALTAGVYYPFYSNYKLKENPWDDDPSFVHLFNHKEPTFTLGFNWRLNFHLALINEDIFVRQHNIYTLNLKWIFRKTFVEFGIVSNNRGWDIGMDNEDKIYFFLMFNFGFSF
ncbi:MAG: hypothetical protein ABSG15_09770, partial [FCB group bacterium]